MEETILQASIPSTGELCCVVAEIDLTEVQDSSAKSDFHWKTLKCRLMLDMMGDSVIACPVYQTLGSIHVVTSVEFFESQLFQKNLKDINIAWSSPKPVTPDVYANCLRYSIYFAIAPRWNKIGQYLIAGKYFLTDTEWNIATKYKLTLDTTNEMKMSAIVKIQPVKIQQRYLTLKDIDIPHEVITNFVDNPRGMIDVTSFGNYRVAVLPSLKKGKLMTAYKFIPASCPFKNYGELRRHWKNMYGYRLPLSDVGMIYYDVYFGSPTAHRFLYPHVCVRSRFDETPYLGNRLATIRNLLRDINDEVPTICGRSFELIDKSNVIENSSIVSRSIKFDRHQNCYQNSFVAKTPERRSNERGIRQNFDDTTRLSFSSRYAWINNQKRGGLDRPLSPSMSPTPSLRGHVSKKENTSDETRGFLTAKSFSVRVCDTKSMTKKIGMTSEMFASQMCQKQSPFAPESGDKQPKMENNEIVSRYFDGHQGCSNGGINRSTLDNRKVQ